MQCEGLILKNRKAFMRVGRPLHHTDTRPSVCTSRALHSLMCVCPQGLRNDRLTVLQAAYEAIGE